MVKFLLVLALGGGRVDVRVVSSHKGLDLCMDAGRSEMARAFAAGRPANFACIETKR